MSFCPFDSHYWQLQKRLQKTEAKQSQLFMAQLDLIAKSGYKDIEKFLYMCLNNWHILWHINSIFNFQSLYC